MADPTRPPAAGMARPTSSPPAPTARTVNRSTTQPFPATTLPPAPAELASRTPSMAAAPVRPAPAPPPPVAVEAPDELIRVHRLPPPDGRERRLIVWGSPDSAAAASFRVLRHRLLERPGLRVILVTSPARREGKTTLAVNLALALGESGRARVLLLEANFRQPAVARMLGFRPPVCFGEQVEFHRTQPQQSWVVVENVSPFLHTAAVAPDWPARPLLDGPAVAIALAQLRGTTYDHIVIDSPHILGSADVNLLEEHVDGVLLALRARSTHARSLRRAIDQIGAAKVIGSVLLG